MSGAFKSDWSIRIDSLSAVMLVVVTSVSALVHLYSWGYMVDDPAKPALLRLPVLLHLRHAGPGEGVRLHAALLRLGRRGARQLPA